MNESTKASIRKYQKEKREQVRLDVPKGTLAKYKAFAEQQGMSMTAYITMLVEREMTESGFNAEWNKRIAAEQAEAEREQAALIEQMKAENAAAMLKGLK